MSSLSLSLVKTTDRQHISYYTLVSFHVTPVEKQSLDQKLTSAGCLGHQEKNPWENHILLEFAFLAYELSQMTKDHAVNQDRNKVQ